MRQGRSSWSPGPAAQVLQRLIDWLIEKYWSISSQIDCISTWGDLRTWDPLGCRRSISSLTSFVFASHCVYVHVCGGGHWCRRLTASVSMCKRHAHCRRRAWTLAQTGSDRCSWISTVTDRNSCDWSIDWLIDWLIDCVWLIGWLIDCLIVYDWLIGCICLFVVFVLDWLIHLLIEWFIDLLIIDLLIVLLYIKQSSNQASKQASKQPTNQTINRSTNQPTNQSINQSVNNKSQWLMKQKYSIRTTL